VLAGVEHRDAHHAFEVTLDYSIRGLTTDFQGSAHLQKNGTINFEAMKWADAGQLLLGFKERFPERLSWTET
jgi:hypothetical protein